MYDNGFQARQFFGQVQVRDMMKQGEELTIEVTHIWCSLNYFAWSAVQKFPCKDFLTQDTQSSMTTVWYKLNFFYSESAHIQHEHNSLLSFCVTKNRGQALLIIIYF